MTKDEIAAVLDEIAVLLQLQGENDFRTKAYSNGARILRSLDGDLAAMVRDGSLQQVRGIGETLYDKIRTLLETGELAMLQRLRSEIPAGLLEMLRVPGLGPKKVKTLHEQLQINSLADLQRACEAGQVAELKGFGAKTQEKILEGIAYLGTIGNRVRLDLALPLGEALLAELLKLPGVRRGALCGSLRRRRETAKDIDILLSSDTPEPIMQAFVKLPQVMQVVAHGPTKSSIVAGMSVDGERVVLNADLRVVADSAFPFALVYFTGSKEHNVRLRSRALEMGLRLNEYALSGEQGDVACADEEAVYAALGLAWVPPELREDTGEIEAAIARTLPQLITPAQIKGVFHNHTTYSDGRHTLDEMARAAMKLGFEYLGVGDHSQSLTVANGMPPDLVRKQLAEIDRLNTTYSGFRILKGIECDILEDGTLDYPDELLQEFDYVVASVHSHFGQPLDVMTARVCKALAHPLVTMLGHPTGRLLLRRDGYKIDLEAVLQTAARHSKMIEINAQPLRLDLDWQHVKRAKSLGISLVINPDAHSMEDLNYFHWGVAVARRGWLSAAEVFNTKSLADVLKTLDRCGLAVRSV